MTALGWIYVGLIALSVLATVSMTLKIGKRPDPITPQRVAVQFVVSGAFIVLYVLTIRALS